jgi:hypothetical protein
MKLAPAKTIIESPKNYTQHEITADINIGGWFLNWLNNTDDPI